MALDPPSRHGFSVPRLSLQAVKAPAPLQHFTRPVSAASSDASGSAQRQPLLAANANQKELSAAALRQARLAQAKAVAATRRQGGGIPAAPGSSTRQSSQSIAANLSPSRCVPDHLL